MRNTITRLISAVLLATLMSCGDEDSATRPITNEPFSDYEEINTVSELKEKLLEVASFKDPDRMEAFIDSLERDGLIPFINEDTVLFIYYGAAETVHWAGDFNGWIAPDNQFLGEKVGSGGPWILEKIFPSDARLDYKIIIDKASWILDSRNPYQQVGGFGPNSELRMPDWVYPEETIVQSGISKGELSDDIIIPSSPFNLGYDVQFRVYAPAGYETLDNLPVIYITDGHEYAIESMGAVVNVLDNLIAQGKIKPVIAVFIDPRDPTNLSINRRGEQYTAKLEFANFVANELVPFIDSSFKTDTSAQSRAIMGTSLGGWNSAYFGMVRPDVFGRLIIHSPAFDQQIIDDYQSSSKLSLEIFMSTGVIYDTQFQARSMRDVMQAKGYNLMYMEVNDGHSWGNWRALIDEPLIFHFPN